MKGSGALDLLDLAGWQDIPPRYADRPLHEHNRLIRSAVLDAGELRGGIREMAARLAKATGPTRFFLPLRGIEEWDRAGGQAHDPDALAALVDEARAVMPKVVPVTEIGAHINDRAFADAVLEQFDAWVEQGVVGRG